MTALSRDLIVAAAARVLGEDHGVCLAHHRTLGGQMADLLGFPAALASSHGEERPGAEGSAPVVRGLWVDDAPAVALREDWLARLEALGLDEIAVMVERSGGGLDVTWSLRQLEALREATPGLRRVVTIWPEPTARYMAGLADALPDIVAALGAVVVELDLEGHWKRGRLQGYPSLDHAAAALLDAVLVSGGAAELEVTTFPAHLEAQARGAVKGEDRLLLQTYAVAEARGEKRTWDGRLGPERRPYEDVLQAQARGEEGVEVCAGLAAWAQDDWPGEPGEAMRIAYASALRAGVRRVRWWSSRHVIGAKRNRYAARAIARMAGAR